MRPHRAFPALLVAAFLSLATVGCGVKVSDDVSASAPQVDGPTSTGPIGEVTTTTRSGGSGTGGSTGTLPKRPTTTRPDPTTTTTTDVGPTTTFDTGSSDFRSSLIDTYQKFGLTQEQATCLTDAIIDSGAIDPANPSSDGLDYTKIGDALAQCNISPSDLNFGGADTPGG